MTHSKFAAVSAVLVGALGVLAVPGAVAAWEWRTSITLLGALYVAAPVAFGLGSIALLIARHVRLRAQRSVFAERLGPLRTARVTAWLGVYAGVTAGIALLVYWVLRARH